MRRHKLLQEIYKHADVLGANKTTLVFLIATMTDKALTKFHKEFMEKNLTKMNKKFTPEEVERLNKEQKRNDRHPYTCDRKAKECEVNQKPRDHEKDGVLIATENGWICPCGKYKQDY
jgi:hypothetical protein